VVVLEVALGKRCAPIDLRQASKRELFEHLLKGADVLIHGYRPDALARLGFDAEHRQELSPGLVDVTLDAYGWTGPWKRETRIRQPCSDELRHCRRRNERNREKPPNAASGSSA
jgi:hypothetical protein